MKTIARIILGMLVFIFLSVGVYCSVRYWDNIAVRVFSLSMLSLPFSWVLGWLINKAEL